jgi:phospholipase/lecithinase/hemolysin
MNAIKSSQAISHVNAELKTNISETGSASIIRVNVPDDGDS